MAVAALAVTLSPVHQHRAVTSCPSAGEMGLGGVSSAAGQLLG